MYLLRPRFSNAGEGIEEEILRSKAALKAQLLLED